MAQGGAGPQVPGCRSWRCWMLLLRCTSSDLLKHKAVVRCKPGAAHISRAWCCRGQLNLSILNSLFHYLELCSPVKQHAA